MREATIPWGMDGFRAHVRAMNPRRFLAQYLSPLFFRKTKAERKKSDYQEFESAQAFWANDGKVMLGEVSLKNFRLTDWFPRAPGVYWGPRAAMARDEVMMRPLNDDPYLGKYVSPASKMGLIEEGGIGSIRLRPRKIDDDICWLATALTGTEGHAMECHQGVPLAVPKTAFDEAGVNWGDQVVIDGSVRFLQDVGLTDTAAYVHHARPLIVYVDKITGAKPKKGLGPIIITPVALFESFESDERRYDRAQYTFVQCPAGEDSVLDAAGEWIGKYAEKFSGRIITNFDEQRPILADAPLSYQKLVAKTYDKTLIEHFSGTIQTAKIDRLVQKSVVQFGDTNVENNINVGGSAIINIDSALNNVNQAIGGAPGLNDEQKSQMESLVTSLKVDLERIKASHADEVKEITSALEKVVANAAKPQVERKKSILELSAKGLKDAAETVKDAAPAILTTAGLIAKFITGLQ